MKNYLEPQKEIPVFCETDVIVVGGGPSGIAAALAASRNGAKTVLIERFGCLGGLQTQCFQMFFSFIDPAIHGGIMQEILTRLEEGGAMPKLKDTPAPTDESLFHRLIAATKGKDKIPKRMYERAGYWWKWGRQFDTEYYKIMLDRMMAQAGVRLLYHTFAVGAIREGNFLAGVLIESKEGRRAVLGKVVIDTSGDGDIAWKSGAPVMGGEGLPVGPHKGRRPGMQNAYCLGGVDVTKFEAFRAANPQEWGPAAVYQGRQMIQQGIKEGYHLRDQGAVIFPRDGGKLWIMYAACQLRQPDGHGWYVDEMTHAEVELREQMWGLHKLFKDKVPGCENCFVEKTPVVPLMGDAHRLLGDYVLKIGDMREGKSFDDAVGICNMPPDLYELMGRFSFDILPFDIPYRSLVSKEIENLMAAGTTMSAGGLSSSSLRYCVPSVIQGQATGTAAALAAKNGVTPKKLNVKQLQEILRGQNVHVSVREMSEEVLAPYQAIRELSLLAGKPELYDELAAC